MKKVLVVALSALLVCASGIAQAVAHDEVVYEYYENGIVKSEMNYANGKRNGKFFEYYPTGVRSREVTYKNDVLDGRARWYNEDGSVSVTVRVRDGQITAGHKRNIDGTLVSLTPEEIAEYQAKLQ